MVCYIELTATDNNMTPFYEQKMFSSLKRLLSYWPTHLQVRKFDTLHICGGPGFFGVTVVK